MQASRLRSWSEVYTDPANWGWGHVAALAGFISVVTYVHSIHSVRLAVGLSAVCLAGLALPLVLLDSWLITRRRAQFHWAFAVVAAMSAVSLTTLIWAGGESALALTAALCGARTLFLSRIARVDESRHQ